MSIILGVMIGSSKGRGGAGFALGFLLGPLGVIIVLFLKPDTALPRLWSPMQTPMAPVK